MGEPLHSVSTAMKELKVLVIASTYPNETDVTRENHIHNQLLHYHEISVQPTVLELSPASSGIKRETFQTIDVIRFGVRPGGLNCSFIFRQLYSRRLRRFLKEILPEFDLVHVNAMSLQLFAVVDLLRGKPLIFTCHGDDVYPSKIRSLEHKRRTLLGHADIATGVSEYTVRLMSNYVDDETRLHYVPNGILEKNFLIVNQQSQSESRTKLNLSLKRKIILMACVLVERKGVREVLQAFHKTRELFPDAYLVIIGKGPLAEWVQNYVHAHNLENDVKMIGYIKDDIAVASYYRASDLYMMFSKTVEHRHGAGVEGFGISYIDANAAGIPVIGGRSGGVESAIVDGRTGYLVDPTNPDAVEQLHRRMKELLENDSLRNTMGEAGRKRVFEEFTWSINVKRIRELYDTMLAEKMS